MNLRDKLRSGGAEEAPAEDAWTPEVEADEPAPRARGKAAPKASAKAAMPKLDVNRRFMMLAGAAAFLTALMGVMYINNSAAGLSEGGTKVTVYVLSEDIPRGAKINEDRLTTADIPKAYLPKGYYEVDEEGKTLEKLKALVSTGAMVAGEPIIEARLSPPNRKLGIAYLLKAGERAKTINVDSASGLAGLIKPGNEVDLIATIQDPDRDNRRIGTPVLQKARVIAVGDHLLGEVRSEEEEAKDESGGIESDSTVTLAVPGSKINLVGLLEDLGNLKVVLRAEGDSTLQKTVYSDDMILALVSGRAPSTKPATKPAARPPVVRSTWTPPRPRVIVREVVRPAPPRPRPVARPVVKPPVPVSRPPANNGGTPQVIRFGGSGGETSIGDE